MSVICQFIIIYAL
ncbi:hypothetical protein F383_23110 [Gossypium arboreum]|uniref:Uncharacterized protein n=1 Tax=Gossypium arboreum TaxID=29729 RepID=A0A0B0N4Y2_GOSAR|nr:hypothetical protein F383_34138 [Gossypium arboreum]KHG16395.1 hypothetical protein F383_23110 [Gossypium arboreum]